MRIETRLERVWVSQYALTRGIREYVDVVHTSARTGVGTVRVERQVVIFPPHWHSTREAAVARAELMRADEIARLKRRIARLEKVRFDE